MNSATEAATESGLGLFFFGSDFELWKLNTTADYLNFFSYILVGILIIIFFTRYISKQRNDAKGKDRVCKRLKSLAKKPQLLLRDVTLKLPEGDQKFDAVLLDKSGIYLVKVFGWGIKVFGTPDGEKWKLQDNQKKEEVPNPLFELRKGVSGIEAILEGKGITKVKVMPMVVFADVFQTPELYLGYGSNATTYQELKKYYQKQSDVRMVQYDFERVSSIFKNGIVK